MSITFVINKDATSNLPNLNREGGVGKSRIGFKEMKRPQTSQVEVTYTIIKTHERTRSHRVEAVEEPAQRRAAVEVVPAIEL